MARGKLIYFGPPADAPQYFGVARVSDIYDRIGERDLAEWEQQFRCSEFHQEFIAKRLAASDQVDGGRQHLDSPGRAGGPAEARPKWSGDAKRPPLWHQFRVLTARFAELLWGDPRSLRLVLLQAPAVAAILLVGFIGKPFDQKLPRLRHVTPQEKNVLVVLSAIEQGLGVEGGADDEVEIGFAVQKLGKLQSVTVAQVREWLNQLGEMPEGTPQRKALEEMQINISSGDATLPIDLKAIREMRQLLRQSKLSTKVLDADKDMPAIPDGYLINPRYTYMLLFMIVIVVLWFGCNTAAKEIVKEEAIYGRERAVNLGILPYLSSKFLLLSVVTLIQAFLLLAIIYGVLEALHSWDSSYEVPPRIYCLDYLESIRRACHPVDDRRGDWSFALVMRREFRPGQRLVALRADSADHPRRRHHGGPGGGPLLVGRRFFAGLLGLPGGPQRRDDIARLFRLPNGLQRRSVVRVRHAGDSTHRPAGPDYRVPSPEGCASGVTL